MVKGTKSEEVCDRLSEKLPEELRLKVKTITLDMAGSMARIARRCFPKAKQIIDRFHVQKEFKEALQNLRIQVMEDENRKIREYKERGEAYHSEVFSNGDTRSSFLQEAGTSSSRTPMTGHRHKGRGQRFSLSNMMT